MQKSKKLLSLIIAVLMLLSICPVVSFAEDIIASGDCGDNLTWVLDNNGTLTISGTGEMYDFTPPYISYGYYHPWYEHKDFITKVIIEDGATTIGENAFYEFPALEDISIPGSVKSISYDAFERCESLKNLVIPEGVTSMYTFRFCYALESLILPASLTEITGDTFWGCSSLKEVIVHEDNPNYTSVDGVLYTKDMTTLLVYPATSERTSFNIPESVTTIWDWAFSYAYNLVEITVPDTVTDMGEGTFAYCVNLETIELSDNIDRIEYDVFNGCIRLKSIVIPANVEYLYAQCFLGCISIEKIVIAGNNFDYSDVFVCHTFIDCISLKDVYIMDSAVILDGCYDECGGFGYTAANPDYTKEQLLELADDAYRSTDYEKFEVFYNNLYYSEEPIKLEDVVIHGYAGSTAEAYALENGFEFVEICNHNYISEVVKEPTFTETGIKADVCEHCGDVINEEEIPMLENDKDVSEDINTPEFPETPEDSEIDDDSASLSIIEKIMQFFQKIVEFFKNLFSF